MTFDESVEYLLSLGNEVSAMKLGLENIRTLLKALGDPQNNYLKVQVAGTNGKGSVCAFLDSICRSAGIRTGLYTSPHLVSMTERVRVDGIEISAADLARLATLVRGTSERLAETGELNSVPTYFEQVTAIGLKAFAEAGVQLAILETGLGGRLDATTAADADVVAITRIDLDHQEYLGETIELIAAEKAAIVRPGVVACVGRQSSRAMAVIDRYCENAGVAPRTLERASWHRRGPTVDFRNVDGWNGGEISLGLGGEHQIENAALAIVVANSLKHTLPITDDSIFRGLADARHPGRLEWAEHQGVRVLLDGAHNESGARALAAHLAEAHPDASICLVYGTMKGKDFDAILEILEPFAADIVLTEPQNTRSVPPAEIAASDVIVRRTVPPSIVTEVAGALDAAATMVRSYARGREAFVLVTGSLYLVGDVKRILGTTTD